MNIIQMRQQARLMKIAQIQHTILKMGGLLKSEEKNLILQCSSEWGMSDRVIKEYIKVALFNIDKDKRNTSDAEINP